MPVPELGSKGEGFCSAEECRITGAAGAKQVIISRVGKGQISI